MSLWVCPHNSMCAVLKPITSRILQGSLTWMLRFGLLVIFNSVMTCGSQGIPIKNKGMSRIAIIILSLKTTPLIPFLILFSWTITKARVKMINYLSRLGHLALHWDQLGRINYIYSCILDFSFQSWTPRIQICMTDTHVYILQKLMSVKIKSDDSAISSGTWPFCTSSSVRDMHL